MKRIQNLILCTLGAALLLSFAACGQKDSGITNEMLVSAIEAGAQPDGPVRPESETVENTEAAGGVVVDYRTEPLATTAAAELKPLQQPPNLTLSYQFDLNGTGLVRQSFVFPAGYDWTVEHENGVGQTTHVDALRPCDNEKTHRLKLDDVADYDYMLDIGWMEKRIESYTLKAYPVGKYDAKATDCTVRDGQIALLKGAYYYELVIHYTQGTVLYGFFVE